MRQTLLWFQEHDLQLPAATPNGELRWKRPSYGSVYQMLTNPVYGGAYAYGKTESSTRYERGAMHKRARRKPRAQWLSLIPHAHEGYVEWERFEHIQQSIHANLQVAVGPPGAAKAGAALLLDCCGADAVPPGSRCITLVVTTTWPVTPVTAGGSIKESRAVSASAAAESTP